jgi:3-oxoacyl-[acyl-carrier protein] reductase
VSPAGELAGHVAVVTGASRGIGRDTAAELARKGASVLLVARGPDDLSEALTACRDAGSGVAASLALDVTAPDAPERIAAAAKDLGGPIDVLVNNAGESRIRAIEDVPEEDWRDAFELNVIAPKRLMDATIPAMAERGWGRIVNVASTAGKRPSSNMPEYSVAKAAQLSLSRLYADRWAASGIAVNAVCPGPVKSEMWMDEGGLLDQTVASTGAASRDEALEGVGSKRPIGRLGEVHEISSVIGFLCSPAASYVSGAAWSVDGGTVQVII